VTTYKTTEEDSLWHGGKVTKVERVPELQDVVKAGVTVIGAMAKAANNAKLNASARTLQDAIRLIGEGHYNRAVELLDCLTKDRDPEVQIAGYYAKGVALLDTQRVDEAIYAFSFSYQIAEKAHLVDKLQSEGLFLYRGIAYLRQGNLRNALSDLSQAIKVSPDDDDGYYWRGIALRQLNDLDLALEDFKRASMINPSNPSIYTERGRVYVVMGQMEKALADYNRALTLDPANETAQQAKRELSTSAAAPLIETTNRSDRDYTDGSHAQGHRLEVEAEHTNNKQIQSNTVVTPKTNESVIQSAYEGYLQTAHRLYVLGIKGTRIEDFRTKPTVSQIIVWWIFLLFGSGLGMLILMSLFQTDTATIVLFIGWIGFLIWCYPRLQYNEDQEGFKEAQRQIKDAEIKLPNFGKFYEEYLRAQVLENMKELQSRTRQIWSGRPENIVSTERARPQPEAQLLGTTASESTVPQLSHPPHNPTQSKMQVFGRDSGLEENAKVVDSQELDFDSHIVQTLKIVRLEGEQLETPESVQTFLCPWCAQSYKVNTNGANIVFACIKCRRQVLITTS